jgi:hypothetical protein
MELDFVRALHELCAEYLSNHDEADDTPNGRAPAKKAAPTKKAAASRAKPAPEPEEEEQDPRLAELLAMGIRQLRSLALKRNFKEAEVKAEKDKTVLAEAIWQDEQANPDADDADEDDDAEDDAEEDEEDGEQQYTREELADKGLRELKALAKTAGFEAAALRGLDSEQVIAKLMGEDEEAEEGEEEGGEEEEFYTEEQLMDMTIAELKALCEEYEIKIPPLAGLPAAKKKKLVAALTAE